MSRFDQSLAGSKRGMIQQSFPSLLLCLFVAGTLSSLAAGQTPPMPVSALLSYTETEEPVAHWGLDVQSVSAPFAKEPTSISTEISRGMLKLRGNETVSLGFLWDRRAGKLFLDCNANSDLTDDAAEAFPSAEGSPSNSRYAHFVKVPLTLNTEHAEHGQIRWLTDITLYNYGRLGGSIAYRSFWSGKALLNGREWEVGVLDVPSPMKEVPPNDLLLRPWEKRGEPFRFQDGTLRGLNWRPELFLDGTAYTLRRDWEKHEEGMRCRVSFAEHPAELGQVSVAGRFIERLVLENAQAVAVFDNPGQSLKVPCGSYSRCTVSLSAEGQASKAQEYNSSPAMLQVQTNEVAQLIIGGPLTNTVSITRRGGVLLLEYSLIGADGQNYRLSNTRDNPRFRATADGKEIGSGQFEFG